MHALLHLPTSITHMYNMYKLQQKQQMMEQIFKKSNDRGTIIILAVYLRTNTYMDRNVDIHQTTMDYIYLYMDRNVVHICRLQIVCACGRVGF